MKLVVRAWPAFLTLGLYGCATYNLPAYSPDGSKLAFGRGGRLYLRSAGRDRLVSERAPDWVGWSADSRRLVFGSPSQVEVASESNGFRPQSLPGTRGLKPPFFWVGDTPFGIRELKKGSEVVRLGHGAHPVARTRMAPNEVYPLDGGRLLLAEGASDLVSSDNLAEAGVFDGRTLKTAPVPDRTRVCGADGHGNVILGRLHGHRVTLIRWRPLGGQSRSIGSLTLPFPPPSSGFNPIGLVHLRCDRHARRFVADLEEVKADRPVANRFWSDVYAFDGRFDQLDRDSKSLEHAPTTMASYLWAGGRWRLVRRRRGGDSAASALDPSAMRMAVERGGDTTEIRL